jgi:putative integral membrane protein (TIGR02587 family)
MPRSEVIGKVALQAIPASFGAVFANSQLAEPAAEAEPRREEAAAGASYGASVFFMLVGAVFVAFNLAPTEEMILIAYRMTPWHGVGLALASLVMMHAFVYGSRFRGTPRRHPDAAWWSLFLRFTVVGYAVALAVSAYILWSFGRFDDGAADLYVMQTVVLGFPASLGAAAARLIL